MTIGEFAEACAVYRRRYAAWETSGGRSDEHSVDVGGFAGDPHTWDRGRDMLYKVQPELAEATAFARSLGLRLLRETQKPHDHLQPLNFPAGPVTEYEGERKSWA